MTKKIGKTNAKGLGNVPYPTPMPDGMLIGGNSNIGYLQRFLGSIHSYILNLNNSKYFAGFVMILLNLGAKVVPVNFSKSTQEYLKNGVSKQIFVFSMAWMGTRDIYTALALTFAFTILSEYLFNEDSKLCVVPKKYRVLHSMVDTNNDGIISEDELAAATKILEKARNAAQKQHREQKAAGIV
jgi:hypothetical protein